MAHSRIWKRDIFCIWNWHIFVFDMNTFSYLKTTYFSFLKMPDFRIWNWHIFQIWNWHNFRICNWHIFRIWNCHISYFKTAHFVFHNKKALWQSNMGNAIIRNVNIRNVKFRGQRQTMKTWSEGFTVSRFQIWVDKVIWEMSALEMSSSEGARANSRKLKIEGFLSFKVSRLQIWGEKVTWGISTF